MGAKVSYNDFQWVYTDEPHSTRRALILAKFPQIKQLMKIDPKFKWTVILMVFIQISTFYLLQNTTSFRFLFILAYIFCGVINHSLLLAIHEISHNQAFGTSKPLANRLFGIFANLPIGIPISVFFKEYHLDHHRYQGDEQMDTDIPLKWEAQLFTNTAKKIIWVILQPLFYSIRPLFSHPKKLTPLGFLSLVIQFLFDYLIGKYLGWHIVAYMIGGTFLSMGLHPVAGHYISEHYIIFKKNKESLEYDDGKSIKNGVHIENGELLIPETCSYYGPLNAITFNVGYYVEHDDFPSIPGTLLPKVRQIAPEYYNTLCFHTSWTMVIFKYITDPDIGPFARVKRPHKNKNNQPKLTKN